jgi:hypothetical protein
MQRTLRHPVGFRIESVPWWDVISRGRDNTRKFVCNPTRIPRVIADEIGKSENLGLSTHPEGIGLRDLFVIRDRCGQQPGFRREKELEGTIDHGIKTRSSGITGSNHCSMAPFLAFTIPASKRRNEERHKGIKH